MAGTGGGSAGSSPLTRDAGGVTKGRRRRVRTLMIGGGVIAVGATAAVLLSRQGGGDGSLARLAVIDHSVSVQGRAAASFATGATGDALAAGDTIRTDDDGRAQLDYAEGSLTRLDRNTTFVVTKLASARHPSPLDVRVDVGRTWHEVAALTSSGERFEVTTSNAVATVRGTVFTVDCSVEQRCVFSVVEGSVEVVTRTGARVLLYAGESVTVLPDGTLDRLVPVSFDALRQSDEWIRFNLEFSRAATSTTTAPGAVTSTTTAGPTTSTLAPPTTASGRRPTTSTSAVTPVPGSTTTASSTGSTTTAATTATTEPVTTVPGTDPTTTTTSTSTTSTTIRTGPTTTSRPPGGP